MAIKCKPNTPLPWIITNEDNILEGAPALTMDSKCPCRYGGVIEFVPLDEYPPDDPATVAEESEQEQTPPPEDVVGDAFAAAVDAAMSAVAETGEAGAAAVQQVQLALAAAAAMPAQGSHSCARDQGQGLINDVGDITLDNALSITDQQRVQNYAHNMAQQFPAGSLDPNGMIINQNMLGDFIINNATASYGGCGAISLYNTIKTLDPNSSVTFPQVVYWMEPYGILNNAFGAVPMGITSALNDLGYETQYCFYQDADKISQAAANADAAITLYATTGNVHYVAFHPEPPDPNSQEQTFTFYNEEQGKVGDSRTYEDFKNSLTDSNRTEIGSVTILVNDKK